MRVSVNFYMPLSFELFVKEKQKLLKPGLIFQGLFNTANVNYGIRLRCAPNHYTKVNDNFELKLHFFLVYLTPLTIIS